MYLRIWQLQLALKPPPSWTQSADLLPSPTTLPPLSLSAHCYGVHGKALAFPVVLQHHEIPCTTGVLFTTGAVLQQWKEMLKQWPGQVELNHEIVG